MVFDEQAMRELNSEALDFQAASESFAQVRKLRWSDMETLGLVTRHQGRKVPTIGAILLFGKDRERHFPDAWIQAGRFQGTNKAHIGDHSSSGRIWCKALKPPSLLSKSTRRMVPRSVRYAARSAVAGRPSLSAMQSSCRAPVVSAPKACAGMTP